jgi:hypothetical protein
MSKYEDTRIVTFKEDYARQAKDKKGQLITVDGRAESKPLMRVFYKKNSTHAIHYKLVDKLREQGAKMEVKELDLKKVRDQRKRKMGERKKKQVELSYQ